MVQPAHADVGTLDTTGSRPSRCVAAAGSGLAGKISIGSVLSEKSSCEFRDSPLIDTTAFNRSPDLDLASCWASRLPLVTRVAARRTVTLLPAGSRLRLPGTEGAPCSREVSR